MISDFCNKYLCFFAAKMRRNCLETIFLILLISFPNFSTSRELPHRTQQLEVSCFQVFPFKCLEMSGCVIPVTKLEVKCLLSYFWFLVFDRNI
jgi:hypothetical protein